MRNEIVKKSVIKLLVLFLMTIMTLFSGCGSGGNSNGNGNGGGNGGIPGDKELFGISISRNQDDGTYELDFEPAEEGWIYPFPKLILNERPFEWDEEIGEIDVEGIRAGNLNYSIIWNGDNLSRTINLSNMTYTIDDKSTGSEWRVSVKGGNGDEKIRVRYDDVDILFSITQEIIISKSETNWLKIDVMHKDFDFSIYNGEKVTAQSKKIAVIEYISLWGFELYD